MCSANAVCTLRVASANLQRRGCMRNNDDSEGQHVALWRHMWSQAQPFPTQATGGAVTGSSTAQGAGSSPFHEAAAQNGFQSGFQPSQQAGFQPSQQGPAVTSQPSLVSQNSTFQQSTGQPPFLVQYGSSVQGQYFLLTPAVASARVEWPVHHHNLL